MIISSLSRLQNPPAIWAYPIEPASNSRAQPRFVLAHIATILYANKFEDLQNDTCIIYGQQHPHH